MAFYIKSHSSKVIWCSQIVICVCLSVLVSMAECADKKPASQLAAKVNGDEISVHQINNALARAPNLPQERVAEIRKGILEKLIEQQLALQQALELKLDRTPEIAMQIEAAKKEIITQAYLSRLAASVAKPSAEQVKQYFAAHPELFALRKIYDMQELVMPSSPSLVAQLQTWSKSKTQDEIVALLKTKAISFMPKSGTRNAEDISLDVLSKLSDAKPGKLLVVETGATVSLLNIKGITSDPIDQATATPRIEKFLATQSLRDIVKTDIERLKNKANIEYLNEFASAAATPVPATPVPAQPNANQQTTIQAPAKSALEKGVSNLK